MEYWNKYKVEVRDDMATFGDYTKTMLLMGMTSEIGDLWQCAVHEIAGQGSNQEDREKILGDMLWYLAALEVHFALPSSLYSRYIGTPMNLNPEHGLDLLGLQTELSNEMGQLASNMKKLNLNDLQFTVNKLMFAVFNVFTYYNTDLLKVLKQSVDLMAEDKLPEVIDHAAEFEKASRSFAEMKYEEVVMEAKIDNRKANKFVGIDMTAYGKVYKFRQGDMVTDFFEASNLLYGTYKEDQHTLNYGPAFRKYLDEDQPYLESAFMIGNRVMTLSAILKSGTLEEGSITLDRTARPVLVYETITEVTHLFDHVMDVRNENKELKAKKEADKAATDLRRKVRNKKKK